ncbi:unnamed protein product [Symbiodinium pilosum]|uniref:Gamma-glutamylcyclotransferase AIG2-like domain-containing protein n=1 Tax=Symbiodinium pilosum TaxID=2952 RepID=A0A812RYY6_SYMPI|nr:unnamed protein product [Symbiodinium pilosum]
MAARAGAVPKRAAVPKAAPKAEPAVRESPKDVVHAVFAYGTLRGDFADSGDHWGVIQRTGAAWLLTSVVGFKLLQEDRAFYPFAVQSDGEQDQLHGTILIWPVGDVSRKAIETCNNIEGFDPDHPEDGLYRRALVEVPVPLKALKDKMKEQPWLKQELEGLDKEALEQEHILVRAYVYHQPLGDKADYSKAFPGGDWLASRKTDEDAR